MAEIGLDLPWTTGTFNKYTYADAYPISDVADAKQRIGGKRWITVVDAKSGYWATPGNQKIVG